MKSKDVQINTQIFQWGELFVYNIHGLLPYFSALPRWMNRGIVNIVDASTVYGYKIKKINCLININITYVIVLNRFLKNRFKHITFIIWVTINHRSTIHKLILVSLYCHLRNIHRQVILYWKVRYNFTVLTVSRFMEL